MKQTIHLLETSLLTPDRYYKVYLMESSLLFVKIGGHFYDETSDEEAPMVLDLILMLLRKVCLNKLKVHRETETDHQVNKNPQALLTKKQNFGISSHMIKKVELNTKASKHTRGNNNGALFLIMEDGTERKYTLPSFVTRKSVINFFECQRISVEIS